MCPRGENAESALEGWRNERASALDRDCVTTTVDNLSPCFDRKAGVQPAPRLHCPPVLERMAKQQLSARRVVCVFVSPLFGKRKKYSFYVRNRPKTINSCFCPLNCIDSSTRSSTQTKGRFPPIIPPETAGFRIYLFDTLQCR